VTALHPITKAVAIHGLDLTPRSSPTPEPDPEGWTQVRHEVATHGLVGLLAAAYEDGNVLLTDEQADEVADFQLTAATVAIDIEAAVLETLDLVEPHDLPVRMLKGVASAHLDYPDPSWRVFNDADLLVRGRDLDRLVDILTGAGYPRELPERRAGFDRRFGKDLTVFGPNLVQLDLHRTFAVGAFGLRQRLDDMWVESTPFVLGGRTVHALVPEDRLLHACFAATLVDESPRVAVLQDIAQLLSRTDLDGDVVVRRAIGWKCEASPRRPRANRARRLPW
jgi:putative nucleotidyltransferase-like protein